VLYRTGYLQNYLKNYYESSSQRIVGGFGLLDEYPRFGIGMDYVTYQSWFWYHIYNGLWYLRRVIWCRVRGQAGGMDSTAMYTWRWLGTVNILVGGPGFSRVRHGLHGSYWYLYSASAGYCQYTSRETRLLTGTAEHRAILNANTSGYRIG